MFGRALTKEVRKGDYRVGPHPMRASARFRGEYERVHDETRRLVRARREADQLSAFPLLAWPIHHSPIIPIERFRTHDEIVRQLVPHDIRPFVEIVAVRPISSDFTSNDS